MLAQQGEPGFVMVEPVDGIPGRIKIPAAVLRVAVGAANGCRHIRVHAKTGDKLGCNRCMAASAQLSLRGCQRLVAKLAAGFEPSVGGISLEDHAGTSSGRYRAGIKSSASTPPESQAKNRKDDDAECDRYGRKERRWPLHSSTR